MVFCLCRKLRLKKDSEDDSNCPQNNFSEYLYRFQDPLKLRETLKAGFLFSLPGQNPNAAGGPGTCLRLDILLIGETACVNYFDLFQICLFLDLMEIMFILLS